MGRFIIVLLKGKAFCQTLHPFSLRSFIYEVSLFFSFLFVLVTFGRRWTSASCFARSAAHKFFTVVFCCGIKCQRHSQHVSEAKWPNRWLIFIHTSNNQNGLNKIRAQLQNPLPVKTQISSANDTESYIFEACLLATQRPETSLIRMRVLKGRCGSTFELEISRQYAWLTEKG